MQSKKLSQYDESHSLELLHHIPSYYVIALDDYRESKLISKTIVNKCEVEKSDELRLIKKMFKDY